MVKTECFPERLNTVLEVAAIATMQVEELKSTQVVKQEIKLSVFTDGSIVNTENLKESTKKPIEVINEFKRS